MLVMFLLNVVLAMVLASAQGGLSASRILVDFAIGYGILWIAKPIFRRDDYFPRMRAAVLYVFIFWRELILATHSIAMAVLFRRRRDMYPNILTYDVEGMQRWEILILSQCITLTPGTTTVDVTPDLKTLYIHAFDAKDPQAVRDSIDRGLKQPLLRWTRPR